MANTFNDGIPASIPTISKPSSREQLKEYCLRKLGKPVIEINVSEQQLEDRIDEAIQMFHTFHYDGVELMFMKHQLTEDDLTGTNSLGQTEPYITIPQEVMAVTRVFPINQHTSLGMFDIRYQIRLNDLYNFFDASLLYYDMVTKQTSLLSKMFAGEQSIRFNQHNNRLYINSSYGSQGVLRAGDYLIIECYRILNPSENSDVFNDLWLKSYCTCLIKLQWGENLKKFDAVQLPSGITLNGQKIWDEAREERQQLEEELRRDWQMGTGFFVG